MAMAQKDSDIFGGVEIDAKVELMRRRNAARVQKMLDARERTIGIDSDFLAAQCEEKRERAAAEDAETAAYGDYEARIREVVWARERAEAAQGEELKAELKGEWAAHATLRAQAAAEAKISAPVQPDLCGMSAAQKFDGEDHAYVRRQELQGKQVQSWLVQQMEEKAARAGEEHDEDARYALYESFVAAQRGDMERDEAERRARTKAALAAANVDDAAKRAARLAGTAADVAALERAEVSARLYDPSLIETTSTAKSRLGDHRYRPDHFKGLAREQVRDIIASNEAIIAANKLAKEEGKDADVDYDNSQAELLRLAHEDEEQHQATVRRAAMEHAEELLAMRDVEREKIRKSKEDRFGYIQGGYLDGFGTSCR
ncbi:RIB43A [Aureococcus anophagefferens]|jgi:hypothetical protein|uniref:RIB43A-like with coiled-coils protein 2 n=2 Tax=Aureococcus anophagefferens TaxID=44056 RepID=F0XWN1_AURAN|nr:hypothetical protein AURANDRAFT_60883 [Aureococcus anophagefferens]EGB12802.1 hypothetical protein AURANDRAFT_60883 [Aureococcus anophagefferens]KAH8076052.1 RIB43A [Aureococcus anophagefferens]|eukprot:XP_009032442.1 hypothetical protein AURANDRAFT_60883 [Aureococcus anophagefferens]